MVALPALHLVARMFPEAERRMLTSFPPHVKAPASSAVLEHTGLIEGYFRYNYATRSPRELLALWWQLRRWRPDVLVYMSGSGTVASAKRNQTFFRICGIRNMIGVPLTEDMQRPRELGPPDAAGIRNLENEGSRLVRNLAELGTIALDDRASWDLHLTEAERARAAEVLLPAGDRPLLAVSVGTKMQAKDWERENWRALLTRLAGTYPTYALALCGAKEESEASEFAAAGWREMAEGPVINLCGVLSPRESGAVFARAKAFLGHDSGPMHLATAVGTTCVAIFASRNIPRVWFPYGKQHRVLYHPVDCAGCQLQTCVVERKKCILSITVDEVLEQVRQVLPEETKGVTLESRA